MGNNKQQQPMRCPERFADAGRPENVPALWASFGVLRNFKQQQPIRCPERFTDAGRPENVPALWASFGVLRNFNRKECAKWQLHR